MKTLLLVCMLTLLASEAPAAPEKSAGSPSVDTQLAVIAQGVGEIKDKLADLASEVRELRAEVSRKADREDVEEIDDRVARDGIAIASMNTDLDGVKKKLTPFPARGSTSCQAQFPQSSGQQLLGCSGWQCPENDRLRGKNRRLHRGDAVHGELFVSRSRH